MAIGAPGSHQPSNEAANILENVWATIMTESATPASSTAASSEVGEEKPEAILQRLPSLGRWISMGAEEWDELLLSGTALTSDASGELIVASPASQDEDRRDRRAGGGGRGRHRAGPEVAPGGGERPRGDWRRRRPGRTPSGARDGARQGRARPRGARRRWTAEGG